MKFLLCAALLAIGPSVKAAPVVVEHHSTAGTFAAIFIPIVASILLAVGGYFGYRRFRHHFKYKRIIAEDGERQTLSMELPNNSVIYEAARGQATELADKARKSTLDLSDKARVQALEYSDKARAQALEYGEKARVQALEYSGKARGYFKVPDAAPVRDFFGGLVTKFKSVKATDEEKAKLQFELPEKKEEESSEEEDEEEEEEEEVPAGKAPKWSADSKKAEFKNVPGAPKAAYDPVPTHVPTKKTVGK
jgi:hypothetical protein